MVASRWRAGKIESFADACHKSCGRNLFERFRGTMPSLIRFIVFCAVLAGLAYGAMFALVAYVEPKPKEVQIRVPSNKLDLR